MDPLSVITAIASITAPFQARVEESISISTVEVAGTCGQPLWTRRRWRVGLLDLVLVATSAGRGPHAQVAHAGFFMTAPIHWMS